jgi:hypothetical protein
MVPWCQNPTCTWYSAWMDFISFFLTTGEYKFKSQGVQQAISDIFFTMEQNN